MNFLKKVKNTFLQIKWYEYLFMSVFYAALITVSCVFKSSALISLNAIFGVTAVFFLTKGLILGQIIGFVQTILYIVMCFQNRYFGEVIVGFSISIPTYIFGVITWLKNKSGENNVVKVSKDVSIKEIIIALLCVSVLSIGIYFLLRSFDTASLIISTLTVCIMIMAGYLLVKRSEYTFIFYIMNCITVICLWMSIIFEKGDKSYWATVVTYFIFLILDAYGVFNWLRLKKAQNSDVNEKIDLVDKPIKEE